MLYVYSPPAQDPDLPPSVGVLSEAVQGCECFSVHPALARNLRPRTPLGSVAVAD